MTSDVHMHPWISYSKISSEGVPSRLLVYLELAKRMAEIANTNSVDSCIIAGDFLNSAENRPMTLNVAKEFLSIVSNEVPIIINPGQHDLDTKSKQVSPVHSIVSLFDDSKVKYIHSGIVNIGKYKAFVQGWDPDGVLIEDDNNSATEIFIGHGVVSGSSTPDGFIFKNGIPQEKLLNRYRLSIIGDIHNGTTFTDNKGRYILVPGPPVQNSYKDPVNCGIWLVNIEEDITFKFIPITGPPFHSFIYSDEIEDSEYIHVRKKTIKSSTKVSSNTLTKSSNTIDILKLIDSEVQLLKPEHPELVTSILEESLSGLTINKTKDIPEIHIKELYVEGFGNIDKLSINFDDLPSPLLILGANGSGKSTFLEAIYWVVTGQSTKGLKVGEVVNRFYPNGCLVRIKLDINGEEVSLSRSRNHNVEGTSVKVIKGSSIEKSTMSDTQSLITSIIGIDPKTIQIACYLSARNIVIFGDLTASDKNDLIGLLSDLEIIDEIRSKIQVRVQNISSAKISSDTLVNSSRIRIGDINSKITNLQTKISNYKQDTSKVESLEAKVRDLQDKLKDIPEDPSVFKSIFETKKSTIESTISTSKSKISTLIKELDTLNSQVKKLDSKVCFTCSQVISDLTTKDLIVSLSTSIRSKADDLKKEKETLVLYNNMLAPVLDNLKLYTSLNTTYQQLNSSIKATQEELIKENSKSTISGDTAVLESLQSDLQTEKVDLVKLESVAKSNYELQSTLTLIGKVLARNGSVIKRLLTNSCKELSDELVTLLTDSKVSASLEVTTKDISLMCSVNGSDRLYTELSSGEKQIIDLALLIAFNNVLSRRYNQPKGILGLTALDEVFSYLDPINSEVAQQIISRSISKNVMIVTHDSTLQCQFSNVLKVEKVNNLATYKLLV